MHACWTITNCYVLPLVLIFPDSLSTYSVGSNFFEEKVDSTKSSHLCEGAHWCNLISQQGQSSCMQVEHTTRTFGVLVKQLFQYSK